MQHSFNKTLSKVLVLLLSTSALTSCIEDGYDLNKDVDLTMALGSSGLSLKLVNTTDSIFMKDVLKVNSSLILDTVTSGPQKHLYYVYQERNSNFNFKVDNVEMQPISNKTTINATIQPNTQVKSVGGSTNMTIKSRRIPEEITSIQSLEAGNNTQLLLYLEARDQNNQLLTINEVSDLKVTFPSYLKIEDSNTHTFNKRNTSSAKSFEIGTVNIEKIIVDENNPLGMTISGDRIIEKDGELSFRIEDLSFAQNEVTAGQKINLSLIAKQNSGSSVTQLNGVVNPNINPKPARMEVFDLLPDFMKGDSIRIYATNSTCRMTFDGRNMPVPLEYTAKVTSHKENRNDISVLLPATGKAYLPEKSNTTTYFYEGKSPFDPDGVKIESKSIKVNGLGKIMITPPEYIEMDMGNKKMSVRQDQLQHIELGKSYSGVASWSMFTPFEFNKNTKIIYNDSTTNLNKDLKNYKASGIIINALIENNMPDSLILKMETYDVNDQIIDGIKINPVSISHATIDNSTNPPTTISRSTKVEVNFEAADPSDVSKIDKIKYHIESINNQETVSVYTSRQTIRLKDIRLKLKGKIIANFN